MTVRTPYLGDTLVWNFQNEDEWRSYLRSRRWFPYNQYGMVFLTLASVVTFFGVGYGPYVLLFVCFFVPLVVQLWRLRNDCKYGLTSVEARLHPRLIKITERYGKPDFLRDRRVEIHNRRRISAMHWVSSGCRIELKRRFLVTPAFVLPMGLFSTQDAIDALYRWAEEHKITIYGVPPLPGAYARPIEERRGI